MDNADQASQTASTIFNDFIGAEKKYKTVDDALASVPHAQQHIARLEADNKALRDQQLAIQARLDALITRSPSTDGVQALPQQNTAGQPVDMEALVEKALARRQLEAKTQENSSKVAAELKQLYADKAESVYVEKARELGLDVQDLNSMAAKSPQAVLALFKQTTQQQSSNVHGGVNTLSLGGSDSVEALMAVLTTDPNTYYSKTHQERLYKAMARQNNN
jgi:hypothetical protein